MVSGKPTETVNDASICFQVGRRKKTRCLGEQSAAPFSARFCLSLQNRWRLIFQDSPRSLRTEEERACSKLR